MGLFAVIKGGIVDGIAIADAPIDSDGMWIDLTNVTPQPALGWGYEDGAFIEPQPPAPPPVEIVTPKTEEEKIADAVAAAITKLIADGVLKQ